MSKKEFKSTRDKVFYRLRIVLYIINCIFALVIATVLSTGIYRICNHSPEYYFSLDFEMYDSFNDLSYSEDLVPMGYETMGYRFSTNFSCKTRDGFCYGFDCVYKDEIHYLLAFTPWDNKIAIVLADIEEEKSESRDYYAEQDYNGNVYVCNKKSNNCYKYNLSEDTLIEVKKEEIIKKRTVIDFTYDSDLICYANINNENISINPQDASQEIYDKMKRWGFNPCELILFGDRILYTVYEYTTSYFGEKLFFYLIFNYDLNTRNVSFEKARNYKYGTTSPILDVPVKKWEDLLNS